MIYVSLAGDGSVADIYIVNMFALDGKTEIRDYGAYSSVRNLTSEADISLDGDSVTVSAEAGTFYYQANLKDAQLPWNISVAYMLDGKNVAADELARGQRTFGNQRIRHEKQIGGRRFL